MQLFVRHIALLVQQAPVRLAHIARFGTYPPQVASVAAVIPDKAIGLQLPDHLVGFRPLVIGGPVDLARLVGAAIPAIASIGSVEPYLEDLAVICQQLAQLVAEILDVGRTSVCWVIPVPRRKIDSELQPLLTTGISQLANHVALAVLPWGVLYTVLCVFRRPHAEPAVVLGGKDDATHASLFAYPCPLAAVQIAGVEQLQVFVAESPFLVGVGVHGVVYKGIHLHILPPQLILCGHRAARFHLCF